MKEIFTKYALPIIALLILMASFTVYAGIETTFAL